MNCKKRPVVKSAFFLGHGLCQKFYERGITRAFPKISHCGASIVFGNISEAQHNLLFRINAGAIELGNAGLRCIIFIESSESRPSPKTCLHCMANFFYTQ